MNISGITKRVETLEDEIGKGDIHYLRIEWGDGTPVTTWEMCGEAFVRVIPEDQDSLQSSIDK